MGYRKIKPVLIHMNTLCQECGLFTSDTELNNGYGCTSKSKFKSDPGCCYDSDCPLAFTADLEDLKEHDTHLYEEYKFNLSEYNKDNFDLDPHDVGSEWVVQFLEVV